MKHVLIHENASTTKNVKCDMYYTTGKLHDNIKKESEKLVKT